MIQVLNYFPGRAAPEYLLTLPAGPEARLQVDQAQTSFFTGKQFRTFKELSIVGNGELYIQATVSADIILLGVQLACDVGSFKLETLAGGTVGTTFTIPEPVIRKNTMSTCPVVSSVVLLNSGGTVSGSTVIDTIRVKTSGNSNLSTSVGATVADERGVGAGVYYFKFTNLDNATSTGVFHTFWEDR